MTVKRELHLHPGMTPILPARSYTVLETARPMTLMPYLAGVTVYLYSGLTRQGPDDHGVKVLTGKGENVTEFVLEVIKQRHPRAYRSIYKRTAPFFIEGRLIVDPARLIEVLETGYVSSKHFVTSALEGDVHDAFNKVMFAGYYIRFDAGREYVDYNDMIERCRARGFYRPPSICVATLDDLEGVYDTWSLTGEMTGILVSPTNYTGLGLDRSTDASRRWVWTPRLETVEGVVDHLRWDTGPKGHVSPVAIFAEPVVVPSTRITIKGVKVYNAWFVKTHGIGRNAKLAVAMQHDCPVLAEVTAPGVIDVPVGCPRCDQPLEQIGYKLFCVDLTCPARITASLSRLVAIAGRPENLSDEMISRWVEGFPVDDDTTVSADAVYDFIVFFKQVQGKGTPYRHELLCLRFGDRAGDLLSALEVSLDRLLATGITYEQFWTMINLPKVSVAAVLRLSNVSPASLKSDHGVSRLSDLGLRPSAIASLTVNEMYWTHLASVIKTRPPVVEAPPPQLKIVAFEGIRYPRPMWVRTLADLGVKVANSVTADVAYIVANQTLSDSLMLKAGKLGIPVITEDQLYSALKAKHNIEVFSGKTE